MKIDLPKNSNEERQATIRKRGHRQQGRATWKKPRTARRGSPRPTLTSLRFALLHLWRHPVIVAALVFPVSLVYGRIRELSGSVWPSALLHFGFNMLLYGASWLQARPD